MENFEAMPRVRVKAHAKTSEDEVGDLIERTNFVSGANFARSHLQKIWDWMYSLYKHQHRADTPGRYGHPAPPLDSPAC